MSYSVAILIGLTLVAFSEPVMAFFAEPEQRLFFRLFCELWMPQGLLFIQ